LLDPTTGQPATISPQLNHILNQVFDALRTTFFQEVDYDNDHTGCFISPTTGHHGDNGGSGGGGE
jgi:hypothetical protein